MSSPASEMDLLTSASDAMSLQRSLLDISARNVAAAQASSPDHPYARLVAQIGAQATPDLDTDFDSVERQTPDPISLAVHVEPSRGDALTEMIAVLDAQRAYEQNASIFDIGKRLAERTIDLERS